MRGPSLSWCFSFTGVAAFLNQDLFHEGSGAPTPLFHAFRLVNVKFFARFTRTVELFWGKAGITLIDLASPKNLVWHIRVKEYIGHGATVLKLGHLGNLQALKKKKTKWILFYFFLKVGFQNFIGENIAFFFQVFPTKMSSSKDFFIPSPPPPRPDIKPEKEPFKNHTNLHLARGNWDLESKGSPKVTGLLRGRLETRTPGLDSKWVGTSNVF